VKSDQGWKCIEILNGSSEGLCTSRDGCEVTSEPNIPILPGQYKDRKKNPVPILTAGEWCKEESCLCEAASKFVPYSDNHLVFRRYLETIKMLEICDKNPKNASFKMVETIGSGGRITDVNQGCYAEISGDWKRICKVGQVCMPTLSGLVCANVLPAAKGSTETLVESPEGMFKVVETPGKGPGYSWASCGRGQTLKETENGVYCMGSKEPLLIKAQDICANTGAGGCLCTPPSDSDSKKKQAVKCRAGERCKTDVNISEGVKCKVEYDYAYCGGPGACKCTTMSSAPPEGGFCHYHESSYVKEVPEEAAVLTKVSILFLYHRATYSDDFEKILDSKRQLEPVLKTHAVIKV
jgi:hypothetical protein